MGVLVTLVVTLKVKWGLGGGQEVTRVTRDAVEVRNGMLGDVCGHNEGRMGLGWGLEVTCVT